MCLCLFSPSANLVNNQKLVFNPELMPGIYIHIPFCQSKCDYCNFFSIASRKGMNEIAAAIGSETEIRKDYPESKNISTIYFGGGTPSLLPVNDIELILEAISKNFNINSSAEITLEANPDDLDREKLIALRMAGINRLSIGIQSFFPDDLAYLNRKHDAPQAEKSIQDAVLAGFTNISIDLIFGIPTQTINRLEENLKIFNRYKLPHLSAYSLTVEPGTALAWKIKNNRLNGVNDEEQARHFLFLMDWMESAGFTQYEISNFCLPGFESKHNAAYWTGDSYLGLGPSAHSFDGNSRQWNISNVSRYLEGIKSGNPFFEKEMLTQVQKQNEFIMTAIRTGAGIDEKEFEIKFGSKKLSELKQKCGPYVSLGWIIRTNTHLKITRQGKLFADRIASELFE